MTSSPPAPTRSEVEERFVALLDGNCSRDEVDRWAAQWVNDPDGGGVDDEVVWWALGLLFGIDLPVGPEEEPFLHDDHQVRQWLVEFRLRCSTPS